MSKNKISNPEEYAKDMALVSTIRNGNEGERLEAQSVIYKEHRKKSLGFLYSKFGHRPKTEDIIQDVFIIFFEKLDDPAFELRCCIQTFLNAVSYRRSLTEFGKPKNEIIPEDDFVDIADEYSAPMEESFMNEMSRTIYSVLDDDSKTNPKCREIIRRSLLQKQTLEQIVKAMEYSNKDSAKSQKSRCLSRLKEEVLKLLKGK